MNTFVHKPKEGSREIANAPSCAESGCPAPPQFTETERGAPVQQRAAFRPSSNQANLQLKNALDRSPRVTAQRKLAAVMANAPVQRRGIPLNDDAALEREADEMGKQAMALQPTQRKAAQDATSGNGNGVVQRVVTEAGWFDPANEPDDQSLDVVSFDDVQKAYALFKQSADELPGWEAVKNDPNTTVHFTTNLDLDAQGSTSLFVTDPDGQEHSAVDEATVQQWSSWIGPDTPVRIEVQVNPRQVDFKMHAVAHTINHEVSLHAIPTLSFIRRLRKQNTAEKRESSALEFYGGEGSESAQHERFVLGKNQNLLFTHKKMMEAAKASGWDAVRDLAGDYRADWTARREGTIAEHKQKVLDLSDNADESKLTEPILLLWLGNYRKRRLQNPDSITAEERTKARAIQELYDVLAYDYEAHRNDVLKEYGFDLYPSVDE